MISAVVSAYNDEIYVKRCLEHLKWADEIVICDMHSTDETIKICKTFTDKIYSHEKAISPIHIRNFAIGKAEGDWVLIVDADEAIPEALAEEIVRLVNSNPGFAAISLPRKNICFGKWLKHVFPIERQTRLFKKGSVFQPERIHSQPIVKGEIYYLPCEEKFSILHYSYDSIAKFIEKMDRYTTDEACHLYKDDGVRFGAFNLIEKPVSEFIHRYFFRKGYKDGKEGFLYSTLMAFYCFTTYVKLWEIEKNKRR